MSDKSLVKAFAILLTITIIVPSVFLVAPQRSYAILGVPTEDFITEFETTITAFKETLNLISTYTNTAANVAEQINTYVLAPLAFIMSGNLLKSLTAGVISFVIGKTNGTGVPQFTMNLQQTMQKVGETKALAFFAQFGTNSNSPFAASIRSSLTTNYLQNTSLAGFWGANQNTLYKSSPNQNAFLAGRWSQGGVAAWFSLTTQPQNNPYILYQRSQAQLASLVANATAARLSELDWGQGFGSWCGVTDQATQDANSAATDYASCIEICNNATGGQTPTCVNACVNAYQQTTGTSGAGAGVNPGDACYNKDGTPGRIQTPGSVIKETLGKVLGSTQDKLVQIGQIGSQIGKIMGNIASVMQTVNFASQILGGSSGGLFTVGGGNSNYSTSRLAAFASTNSGYLGASNSGVYQGAAGVSISGPDKSKLVDKYEEGWGNIRTATNAALANVTELASFCDAAVVTALNVITSNSCEANKKSAFIATATAQAEEARATISTKITPVLNRMDPGAVGAVVCKARAMIEKIQCELNAPANTVVYCDRTCDSSNQIIPANTNVPTDVTREYPADLQTLQTMKPTDEDVATLQQESSSLGVAQANPPGSLNVSASPSIVDQMNFISANAQALKSVCTPPPFTCTAGGGSGSEGSSS